MVVLASGTGGFLNPQKIINEIEIIEEGMKIADFGCGHGYFSLPLARKVGDNGKIFALDVLSEALEAVKSRMKLEGVQNIETKRCNLEKERGSGLSDESCDMVWLVNLLFQTEDDEVVIREARRVLKKEGNLVFIDWRPNVSLGPQGKRIGIDKATDLFKRENFSLREEFPTDNYHYGMIFKKI